MKQKWFSFTTILFVLLSLAGESAEARRSGHNYISIASQVHSYVDILRPESTDSAELSPDVSLNIDFRVYRIFSLMLIGGQALDSSRMFYGLGFRADLPGIFFIGGNVNDLIHRKRRRGTTTYFSYQNLIIDLKDGSSNVDGQRFALGLDFDLNDTFYLNVEPAIYSQDGNRFFSGALGLGIEF